MIVENGKEVKILRDNMPFGQPGRGEFGTYFIAYSRSPRVTERQRDGSVVWQYTPPGQPVSCQRLPNGNTFVATYNELVEVTREKAVVFSVKLPTQMVFYGQKLRNGHYLYVSNCNRIVELDGNGKEVLTVSVENSGSWASVESLPNGNFLVALYNARKVVELEGAKLFFPEERPDEFADALRALW